MKARIRRRHHTVNSTSLGLGKPGAVEQMIFPCWPQDQRQCSPPTAPLGYIAAATTKRTANERNRADRCAAECTLYAGAPNYASGRRLTHSPKHTCFRRYRDSIHGFPLHHPCHLRSWQRDRPGSEPGMAPEDDFKHPCSPTGDEPHQTPHEAADIRWEAASGPFARLAQSPTLLRCMSRPGWNARRSNTSPGLPSHRRLPSLRHRSIPRGSPALGWRREHSR